ncbi:hypothetical protein DENIT_20103 [Pseudomonas veronii]|nr:hypothetical protein DENIT_20103 [Pseudomonas veronii]
MRRITSLSIYDNGQRILTFEAEIHDLVDELAKSAVKWGFPIVLSPSWTLVVAPDSFVFRVGNPSRNVSQEPCLPRPRPSATYSGM